MEEHISSPDKKKLVDENIRLASKEAIKYARKFSYGWPMKTSEIYNELLQEGVIGLGEASKRFDESIGTKFSTYAIPWIKKYILMYLENTHDGINESLDEEVYLPEYDALVSKVDILEDENSKMPYAFSDENEIQKLVHDIMSSLTEKERLIITKHFGMDGKKPMTFKEIGDEMGVTGQRIFTIEKNAIKRMRSKFSNEDILELLNT